VELNNKTAIRKFFLVKTNNKSLFFLLTDTVFVKIAAGQVSNSVWKKNSEGEGKLDWTLQGKNRASNKPSYLKFILERFSVTLYC